MRPLAACLCMLCLAFVAPAPAAAEDAAALLAQGRRQFSEAEFKVAIATLEQARRATRDAKLLGQIYLYLGLSNAVIGDMERARECFATALGYDPNVKLDLKQFREDLVKLLEQVRAERVGTLKVTAEREGATATIDGGQARSLPLTMSLVAGSHTVKVTGPDGQGWLSETVTIVGRETKELRAAPPRPELQPASAPAGEQPSFWGRRRIWTWVALGGAAAVLVAAVGCGAAAIAKDKGAETSEDERQQIHDLDLAANVMYGVAGGLFATSVVLLFLEGRPSADAGKRSLRLSPLVGQTNGLQLVGRF